jgi:hypothetical protein
MDAKPRYRIPLHLKRLGFKFVGSTFVVGLCPRL